MGIIVAAWADRIFVSYLIFFIIINWHARAREETVILDQARGPKTEMRMSPADVEQVVVPAGFILEEVVDLPPYHYAAVFQVA